MNKKKMMLLLPALLLLLLSIFSFHTVFAFVENEYYRLEVKTNSGKVDGIPVIAYHCINSSIYGHEGMFVSPAHFLQQMDYLHQEGYTPIQFSQMDHLSKVSKPILITFDDGYEDNYTFAYPVLKKFHFKATLFMVSNFIDKNRYLSKSEMLEMRDLIDFESHTVHHDKLTKLSPEELEREMKDSRQALAKLLKKKVTVISYPFGAFDADVLKAARKYYQYGVATTSPFQIDFSKDYQIKRVCINDNMSIDAFQRMIEP